MNTTAVDAKLDTHRQPRPSLSGVSPRLTWLGTFVALTLLGGMWTIASPLFSVPDEPSHAIYAAGAVRGELLKPTQGSLTTVVVPRTYEQARSVPSCYAFNPEQPAGCQGAFDRRGGTAGVQTSAGRYPPAYYLFAGVPTLLDEGVLGVYLARFVTVLLCSAVLASAVVSVTALGRDRAIALVGVATAVTPMTMFFMGAVNPQALEIVAAIGLWTSLSILLAGGGRLAPTGALGKGRLIVRAGVTACLLALARPVSPLWLVLIVLLVTLALGNGPALRALVADWRTWVWGGAAVVCAAFTTLWVFQTNSLLQLQSSDWATAPWSVALRVSSSKLDGEYKEMIGVFGWLDTPAPGMTPALWSCVVGALVTLGLALGDRRSVVATILLVVLVLAVPVLMELTKYRESGFPWQGRYTLPLAVGVPIVAGVALAVSNRLPSPLARRLSLVALPFLGVANAVAYWGALHRYLFGASAGWSSAPAWNPPASPILLLAAGSVAIAVYVAWFWFLVEQSRRGPGVEGVLART